MGEISNFLIIHLQINSSNVVSNFFNFKIYFCSLMGVQDIHESVIKLTL